MKYTIEHSTTYDYSDPASVSKNLARLTPRLTPRQQCADFSLSIDPLPEFLDQESDYFGNTMHHFGTSVAHRQLKITARSKVNVDPTPNTPETFSPAWESIAACLTAGPNSARLDAFYHTLPSARIQRGDALRDYAAVSFTAGRPVIAAAFDLTRRINSEFEFDPTATEVHTPTEEVLRHRRGVCQDFAHLMIGCARSLNLAARYVSGYVRTAPPPGQPRLVGADASHAWVAVWCGDELGWIDFDPTNNSMPSTDHVTLAWGRDYADVCPIQGVFHGGGQHTVNVGVDVVPEEEMEQSQTQSQTQGSQSQSQTQQPQAQQQSQQQQQGWGY